MEPNQLLVLDVSGPELTADDRDLIRAIQPGGFVLAASKLVDIAQTRRLTDGLRTLCDTEPFLFLRPTGGDIWPAGLLDHPPPTAEQFRAKGDPKLIMTGGWITGRLLRLLGLNIHLAPDLGIGGAGWGHDDQEVINNAGTFNRYQRKQGILGCGHQFPGGTPTADLDINALLRSPLLPYTALMPELDGILPGNTVFPKIDPLSPASLSHQIVTRLLRDQLGYKRLVLAESSDHAAINAGADLLILRDVFSAPEALAGLHALSGYTLSDAIDRIEYAKKRLHKPTKLSPKNLERLQQDARDLQSKL